jgi:hypothetical protein
MGAFRFAMAARTLTPASVPTTYAELRRAVKLTLIKGQQAIDLAKVRTYHETGRLIREHLLANQNRADYGAKMILRLSADLKVDRSVLQRCDQFYRAFPICATWHKLAWAHFRELLPVADAKQRNVLATEANRNAWSVVELTQRIRALAPREEIAAAAIPTVGQPPKLLTPQRGTPGLHLIVDRGDGLAVDLGFKLYWPLTTDQAKRFAKGDIVRIASDDSIRLAPNATKTDLFTYAAQLPRVVDGDTLVVALEISPGVFIEQKLRLRGLDCLEMKTPEGRAAKRFVDALVANTTVVVINTTKPDKYDRYLADVFLRQAKDVAGLVEPGPGSATPATGLAETDEIFLNNALLENG